MPNDLIYREDAKDYVRHAMVKGLNAVEYLDEAPAAEFRPVVRGEWIDLERVGFYSIEAACNHCGRRMIYTSWWSFCPNCGADMRGEKSV